MKDAGITHFESLAEFARACQKRDIGGIGSDRWSGGTVEDAYSFALQGDVSHVPEAEAMADKVLSQIDFSDLVPRWEPSPVGFFPIVPNALAGVPDSMLAREEMPAQDSEIEIWANTTVSGACSAKDMVRRGVVTLALAIALEHVRPVRLVLYSTMDRHNVAIRLSSPLDVSEVCAAFCQPSVTRRLVYGWDMQNGSRGKWASWAETQKGRDEEREALVKVMGMPKDALHLSTEKLGRYSYVSDAQLVEIINSKVREFMDRQAGE